MYCSHEARLERQKCWTKQFAYRIFYISWCSDAFEGWWDILLSLYNKLVGERILNKLAPYGTDGRLFAADICAKFKVT